MRDRLNFPENVELSDNRLRELRRAVLSEIKESPSAVPRRFRAIPATVLLLVFVTATAAGAAIFLRQEFDPSTEVLPAGRAEAIARLGAEIPLPPGGNFDALLEVDYTEDEKGLAASLAFNAWCQWTGSWVKGELGREPSRSMEALDVMEDVPSWTQLTEVDGGGVIVGLEAVVASARGRDFDAVALHYTTNCTGIDPELDTTLATIQSPETGDGPQPAESPSVAEGCESLAELLADASASESKEDVVAALQQAAEVAASGLGSERVAGLFTAASVSPDPHESLTSLNEELTAVCEGSS